MLVTHYDSSHAKKERYAEKDGSYGAADAGYGLSTILDTIRAIKENNVPSKKWYKNTNNRWGRIWSFRS